MPGLVLVTGGTGFVGGWAVVELLRRGYDVRTTVRRLEKAETVRRSVAREIDPGRLSFAVADLTSDAGWDEAMAGCEGVLHIASPLGNEPDEAKLFEAAVGGTRRVLSATRRAGVPKVVMTSSTAACTPASPLKRAITEEDWTDPDQPGLAAYRKSKLLSERAAWAVMADYPHFATILPGAIFGPVLNRDQLGSVAIIGNLLKGAPPALPRLGFNITDVRDLVDLHIRALENPAAAGQRFIAMGDALWYPEVAAVLRERLGEAAAKVPTATMPDLAFRALAAVNSQMKSLLPLLGRTQAFSTERARSVLGFAPRPPADTVADCAASLV